MTELENELREHAHRVREHVRPAVDIESISVRGKRRRSRRLIVLIAACIAVIGGASATTTALKAWDIRLLGFFRTDYESAGGAENAYEIPMVSETVNSTAVTVEQAVFDENTQFVLYEVKLPDGFNADPSLDYAFEDCGLDVPLAEEKDVIGTIKNEVVEIKGDSVAFVLWQTMPSEPVENKKVCLYLSNFGYTDGETHEFKTLTEGNWSLEWRPGWESAGKIYTPGVPFGMDNGSILEKVIVSPFAVTVKIKGADVLGSIGIKVYLKNGGAVVCGAGDPNADYIRSGDISFVYFRFDRLTDIGDIERILVNDVEIKL